MMASIWELVPVDFFVFVGLLALSVVALGGWSIEREKRLRLLEAMKELERIQHLTAVALQEHSREKVEKVNEMIGSWDDAYTEEVGEPVAKLNPNPTG